MTAKEYLNGIRRKRLHCQMLEEKRAELETQAQGMKAITYDKDRVQTSPRNSMETLVTQMVALEEMYGKVLWEYHTANLKAERQIKSMSNAAYAEVLWKRYMEDDENGRQKSIARISCEMYKSYEWVRHVHGNALREFEKLYL